MDRRSNLARSTHDLARGARDRTVRAALTVDPKGAWFRVGTGKTIELGRREPLKRLLAVLAEHRVIAPGAPLSHDFVFMSAWPGELPSTEEVRRRLVGALAVLDGLGLGGTFVLTRDSLHIDPRIEVDLNGLRVV